MEPSTSLVKYEPRTEFTRKRDQQQKEIEEIDLTYDDDDDWPQSKYVWKVESKWNKKDWKREAINLRQQIQELEKNFQDSLYNWKTIKSSYDTYVFWNPEIAKSEETRTFTRDWNIKNIVDKVKDKNGEFLKVNWEPTWIKKEDLNCPKRIQEYTEERNKNKRRKLNKAYRSL